MTRIKMIVVLAGSIAPLFAICQANATELTLSGGKAFPRNWPETSANLSAAALGEDIRCGH